MGSVQVSIAGRSDQTRATVTVPAGVQSLNPNAAPSPDQNAYEAYPGRCIQLKLDGTRCKGKGIPSKQGMCMVHATKEPLDDES